MKGTLNENNITNELKGSEKFGRKTKRILYFIAKRAAMKLNSSYPGDCGLVCNDALIGMSLHWSTSNYRHIYVVLLQINASAYVGPCWYVYMAVIVVRWLAFAH